MKFDRVVNEKWSIYIDDQGNEVFVEDNRGKVIEREANLSAWSSTLQGGKLWDLK